MTLHFDYTASKAYCEQIGLVWADGLVDAADEDCFKAGMTQSQIDVALQHHLWNVKHLFNPSAYIFMDRIKLALWFLFKVKP